MVRGWQPTPSKNVYSITPINQATFSLGVVRLHHLWQVFFTYIFVNRQDGWKRSKFQLGSKTHLGSDRRFKLWNYKYSLGRYRLGHLSVLLKFHLQQGLMYSQATITLISIEESGACVIRWIENWNLGSTRRLRSLGKVSSSSCASVWLAHNWGD